VLEHRPNAQLILVGPPGWGTNEGAPGIRQLVSAGSVVEAGHVPDAQLRWAYEHAAVTLCPSLLEGFGLPVVEALGLGCPVILSADPAQVEAAAGAGTPISLRDRGAWVEAIVRHLDGVPRPQPAIRRTWNDAAFELAASTAHVQLQLSARR
jgi:glycosyltransferase involved in cell wall biosynthesis